MPPKFAAMKMPKGAYIDNEANHNFADLNGGGGPHGVRNKPSMPMRSRTGAGTGANGRDPAPSVSTGGRGGSGMPSGSFRGEARGGAETAETRVSGHGGSPQHRERMQGAFDSRGGVGANAQANVPGGRASNLGRMGGNVTGSGNTSGRSYRLVAGRFKRAAMGAKASGGESKGQYGSAPITANT